MSDLVTPATARARAALARRSILRLHTPDEQVDAPGATAPGAPDDRLLRRELLLHHLDMERQRRRRRSA